MENKSQRDKDFFEKNGYWPVSDDSVPDDEKVFLTEEQITEAELQAVKVNAIQYLNQTDWYVVRKSETGKEIPADILEARQKARIDADNI